MYIYNNRKSVYQYDMIIDMSSLKKSAILCQFQSQCG